MNKVYVCDAIRTPIGRYGGGLATIRSDDLAAIAIKALMERQPQLYGANIDDVVMGCANQAGEDNRNVARMALLLAGLPQSVPGVTVNRLCGSGLNAIGDGMRAIMTGEAELIIAAGMESMSRAPYVTGKPTHAFDRNQQTFDTTMGWRFVNPKLAQMYGVETMPQTAENLAEHYQISRVEQDAFALWSQRKAAKAIEEGKLAQEITAVEVKSKKTTITINQDEHPRNTSLEKLSSLKPIFEAGSVTAGNASGINDGAAAMLLASEKAMGEYQLTPKAQVLGMATVGVTPSMMGIGPVPAVQKLLKQHNLTLDDIGIIELNEAFAAQALACIKALGLKPDDPRINPQGGAIAYGHPLGMSGTRLATTATYQLMQSEHRFALCTMCIGVGQGIAVLLERV